jgi:hypothetical protein
VNEEAELAPSGKSLNKGRGWKATEGAQLKKAHERSETRDDLTRSAL